MAHLLMCLSFAAGGLLASCTASDHGKPCAEGDPTCQTTPATKGPSLLQSRKFGNRINVDSAAEDEYEADEDEYTGYIGGIRVYNLFKYHPGGPNSSLLEVKRTVQRLIVDFPSNTSDADLDKFCSEVKHDCKLKGHPTEKGIPYVVINEAPEDIEETFSKHKEIIFAEVDGVVRAIPEILPTEFEAPSLLSWGGGSSGRRRGLSWGLDRIDDSSGLDG